MKKLFIALFLFASFNAFAQPICCAPPDSCSQHWIDSVAEAKAKAYFDNTFPNRLKSNKDSAAYVKKGYRIIIEGQSNAIGRADTGDLRTAPLKDIPDNLRVVFKNVYMSNNYGDYFPIQIGVTNKGYNAASFGAEMGIAYRWAIEHPNEYLFIDKFTIDGNPIASFQKGTTYYDVNYPIRRTNMNNWIKNHGFEVTDIGYIWIQGESDYQQSASYYLTKLNAVYNDRLADGYIKNGTKIVISGISTSSSLYGAGVESAFQSFVSNHTNAYYINNNASPLQSDVLHYNGEGVMRIGYAAYEKIFDADTMGVKSHKRSLTPAVTINGQAPVNGNIDIPKSAPYDSTITFSGTIYPTRSNGINTWHLRIDGQTTPYNMKDSLVINGNYLEIPYSKYNISKISYAGGFNNEVTSHVATSSAGSTYQLAMNGFNGLGSRPLTDRLQLTCSRIMEMQLYVVYDSLNNRFVKNQILPNPVNLANSYAPVITYGKTAGRLYIQISTQGIFRPNKYPTVREAVWDITAEPYSLVISPIQADLNRFLVRDRHGDPITSDAPPNNLAFMIEWGSVFGYEDWATYDFGSQAKFYVTGQLKTSN